ncbi:hypothetical protein [Cryptosporangium japonicum]|uniref:Uncharacterized protein n=1 Tax=Cryptosporangium japonicum TaxID=80872 RepID=A0ABP3DX84_9ACTN
MTDVSNDTTDVGPFVSAAAPIGPLGAVLFTVSWAFSLSDPPSGTGLWYAANAVGAAALAGLLVLVLALFVVREAGPGAAGRGFLALWALGLTVLLAGGVHSLAVGNQDTVLLPIGGITAAVGALGGAILIARNRRLAGSPRRWAPLVYAAGTFVTGFFQGPEHTLRVNLADLVTNLLLLGLAGAFHAGVAASRKRTA